MISIVFYYLLRTLTKTFSWVLVELFKIKKKILFALSGNIFGILTILIVKCTKYTIFLVHNYVITYTINIVVLIIYNLPNEHKSSACKIPIVFLLLSVKYFILSVSSFGTNKVKIATYTWNASYLTVS